MSSLRVVQKTKYIDDLESMTLIWALRGEAPALYHILRLVKPQIIREFDASLSNVIRYGASAAVSAKENKLQKHNVVKGMVDATEANENALTDSALGAQASALIVAGSGTTAVTLTYAIWVILSHPAVKSKLMQEVSALPDTFDDTMLENLPYLKAVITETLRLYGSAPGSLPRIAPDHGISVQGVFLPAGTTVTTQSYTMHRDPAIFPDPEK